MLLDTIKLQITDAPKAGDHLRLETLRGVLSAVGYASITKYGASGQASMTDEDVLEVLKKQAKTRKESIIAFTTGNRPDLAEKEEKELAIIQEYLPKELSDEEIATLLSPLLSSGEKNFGLLMKQAMALVNGKVDGGRVSAILKKLVTAA